MDLIKWATDINAIGYTFIFICWYSFYMLRSEDQPFNSIHLRSSAFQPNLTSLEAKAYWLSVDYIQHQVWL